MAEVKRVEQYQQQQNPKKSFETPTQPSPRHPLKRITKMEKVVAAVMIALIVSLTFGTLIIRNQVMKVTQDITSLNENVTERQQDIDKLQQEKMELTRSDRLKEAAEKAGLTANDENIRNVK